MSANAHGSYKGKIRKEKETRIRIEIMERKRLMTGGGGVNEPDPVRSSASHIEWFKHGIRVDYRYCCNRGPGSLFNTWSAFFSNKKNVFNQLHAII
jgi:hypothetical protein